jgi:putative ABC transport system permease protein
MLLFENIKMAFRSIRSNWLRSLITAMIIAFGIMALVGILTAIDSILGSMSSSFSNLGSNSFTINRSGDRLGGQRRGMILKQAPIITFRQANDFKQKFTFPARVSLNVRADNLAVIRYGEFKTNPNVTVYGIDENYLIVNGYDLELGRNFTEHECETGAMRIILGKDLVDLLFDGKPEQALDRIVYLQSQPYRVIGILKSKGSSFNQSADRVSLIPIQVARQQFSVSSRNFPISVFVPNVDMMPEAIESSISVMRNIRKIKPGSENNFEINKSDNILNILKDNTATIRIATIGIGLITLFGAAIGLMNIMLVSVTERTREIGLCKAVGATKTNIMMQFLTETLVICQLGGILGIILGMLAGNAVSFFTGGAFIIPWAWILVGLVTCFVIGLASGIYPAMKAANMDPIEALRYE